MSSEILCCVIHLISLQLSTAPSEPWRVSASPVNCDEVQLKWEHPLHPRGKILGYKVYMTPPVPPLATETKETQLMIKYDFEANTNYSFWVIINNSFSETVTSFLNLILWNTAITIIIQRWLHAIAKLRVTALLL